MEASVNRQRIANLQAQELTPTNTTTMPEAFKRLLNTHYREQYRVQLARAMRSLVNSHDAEDAVQNTYVRACEYWYSINNLDRWFPIALANSIRDTVRERMKHGMVYPIDEHEHELAVEPLGEDYETLKYAIGQIGDQPPHKKPILTMYFFEGAKQAEIAKRLNVTVKTVEHTIARFRQTLR